MPSGERANASGVSKGRLRAVELLVARVDDLGGALEVHAERLMGGDGSWQYAFRVEHAGALLAQGRAAVMVAMAEHVSHA